MQIILVHPRLTKARSVTLKSRYLIGLVVFFVVSVVVAGYALLLVTSSYFPDLALRAGIGGQPGVSAMPAQDPQGQYVRENIAAMAVKVGEMQAQIMRLDALGERVQGLAGIPPETFRFGEKPGRGGTAPAEAAGSPNGNLTLANFRLELERLAAAIESRTDYLNVVETALMREKVQFKALPTVQPVRLSYNASGFGWRIDPINGRQAFHEGIDFPGPVGTPVVAAAGGVVIAAEFHPQYGNMIEIDHGNDIVTRYAHSSVLHAKVGDIVRRGQRIADLGSSGRSTGAHLHFEVLVRGVQQDPHKFLSAGADALGRFLLSTR